MLLRSLATLARHSGPAPPAAAAAAAARRLAASAADGGGGASWAPSWLRSRLPAALGGEREELAALQDLTMDSYLTSLRGARKLGGLTGYAAGTSSAGDATAQGTLRLFEGIIDAMAPAERAEPGSAAAFGPAARARVAAAAGASPEQVDDCVARFLWTRKMSGHMAELRKAGKPMPKSVDEVERMLGSWRDFKRSGAGGGGGGRSGRMVAAGAAGAGGAPCPLAGQPVGRNTRCPATRRAYKNCCGRGAAAAALAAAAPAAAAVGL
jgi:hypothetical protein